jgi:hypothetical protein
LYSLRISISKDWDCCTVPVGLAVIENVRADCHTNIRQMTKTAEAAMGDPDTKQVHECRYAGAHDMRHCVTIQASLQLGQSTRKAIVDPERMCIGAKGVSADSVKNGDGVCPSMCLRAASERVTP